MPSALRNRLSQKLRELGVEERAWPGRDDGFASLLFRGQEFAHFHTHCEIDVRLGKDVIRRERLVHPSDSTVHPGRSRNSPWYEMKVSSATDVDEAVRLVQIAIQGLRGGK
ncbi:MAG TPA: luciferase family protein [Povalibacter sp.]|nr:luciferase family protein [Povalibacter sp.]